MTRAREEADSIYRLLTDEAVKLGKSQRESYEFKLLKLVEILKDDLNYSYYIQRNQVEIWDTLEFSNIKYIYNKLKCLDFYSGAKEV